MECILSGSTEENNKYTHITMGIIEVYTGKTVETLETNSSADSRREEPSDRANCGACKEQRVSGTCLPSQSAFNHQIFGTKLIHESSPLRLLSSSKFKELNKLFSWSRSLCALKPFHKWQRGRDIG